MFRLLYILALAMITQIGQSQTKKAFLKAAEEKLEKRDYYAALSYYSEALEFDSTDIDVRYKLAESARGFNAYTTAAANYSYILDVDTIGTYPAASLRLGEMWMMLGNYDEAVNLFNIYLGEHSGEAEDLDSIATSGIASAEYAKEKMQYADTSTVISRLPNGINTPYSEFAARQLGESILYTSHGYGYDDGPDGQQVLGRVLESIDRGAGELINLDDMYASRSVANATFSSDSMVILTICEYVGVDELRCDLYETTFVSDSTFGTPIPLSINVDTATTTQPFLMEDRAGAKYLYFVSDRAGGAGKLDIYYSRLEGDNLWSDPVNLTSINTAGDDISPSYSYPDGRLYWSTNGRQTLGGYDIYSAARYADDSYSDIVHLDAPVNSSFNEIYYTVVPAGDKAYFSSNRTGSLYIEPGQEACCYDIYETSLEVIKLDLLAMTYDLLTQDTLTDVTVSLYDATTGRLIGTSNNLDGKDHTFDLVQGREYYIVSSKPGYYNDTLQLNTTGLDGTIERKIFLDSDRYALDILTYDKRTGAALPGTTVTLIDLSDNSIAEIVQVNELGNDYLFILEPGKRYRIEASKDGFITSTAEVNTIGDDIDKRIKLDMYLDSYDLNIHLPVNVYFANDQPDPGSTRTSTDKTYSDLYYSYIEEEKAYKRRNPSESVQLEAFFADNVKGGYVQMQKFYDELFKAMEAGQAIELTIKGHTSPLAVNKYNLVLGQRRVESVKNDLASYRGGILSQYLDNGQILITDISYGEEITPADVSDQSTNKRSSIYSVNAAQERRVEIIKATKQR